MSFFRYTSLSTKLSVTTSIVAAMLVMGIAVYALMLKSNEVILSEMRDIDLSLSNTALSIDKRLSQVEASVISNTWQIDKCLDAGSAESVGEVLTQLIALNNQISGCGVILGIDQTGTLEKPYMIYADRDSSASNKSLPAMVMDRRNLSYKWLHTPIEGRRGVWSGPHADLADGRRQVCTYIVEVHDRTDRGRALMFADVNVEVMTGIIAQDMPKFLTESFLLDADGQVISFVEKPGSESLHRSSVDDAGIRQALAAVGDSVREGDHGSFDFMLESERHPAYYDVINSSGWILYYVVEVSLFKTSLMKSTQTVVVIFLLSLVCLYIVISIVIKRVTRPLRQFSDAAIEIAQGKFNEPLPLVDSRDEMSRLHDSFATMQRSLNEYMRKIEESSFIMGELRIATRIQDDLLPKAFPPFPERDDINVHATLIPATQIGGDLYNYFIRDSKLFFIIGDVSGKSVPAAIVMAIACTVFKTVASIVSDPVQIMRELNAITCSNNEHSHFFITALVGVLDLASGNLEVCNAGHDPMVILRPESKAEVMHLTPNLPVGVDVDYDYKGEQLTLAPGSRMVLYTDGITESEHPTEGFYGLNRLTALITRDAQMPLTTLVDDVVHDVKEFSANAELADDLTLMGIDYTPSEVAMPPILTLTNDATDIARASTAADEACKRLCLDKSLTMKVHLVIEEALSNIINHSTAKAKRLTITLFFAVHGNTLSIIISDDGRKFDPTTVPPADITVPLDQRPIGGLGLTLIRTITSAMMYRRLNGRNYLTMEISI